MPPSGREGAPAGPGAVPTAPCQRTPGCAPWHPVLPRGSSRWQPRAAPPMHCHSRLHRPPAPPAGQAALARPGHAADDGSHALRSTGCSWGTPEMPR
ncbi:hypothetical protein G6F22_021864 [Rhizopus arrhizus]|nr:hypothetical protein G6F22_021864 [Rhizopus arrhizus]KAG1170384.1 hypothetical protein G6F35_017221 [Rhizopus arrhizus]